MASRTCESTQFPTRASRSPPTQSCASPRRRSAGPTYTSTTSWDRSWRRGTSSGTSQWESSRVGSAVEHIRPGDRVVVPFNISCGHASCATCSVTRSARTPRTASTAPGFALRYTKLYGHVPGAQAEYLRVPQAHFGRSGPDRSSDERFLYLSDVLPTAWQAVEYADIPSGGSVAVFGLGPIGQMSSRIAKHRGARVIAVDLVPERLEMAERHGVETLDLEEVDDVAEAVRELTDGRGTDSVIDAVGMEAHATGPSRWCRSSLTDYRMPWPRP